MQRTDHVPFCSIFSVLLAASIFFVGGCDDSSSGSTVSLARETAFLFTGDQQEIIVSAGVTFITVQAFGGGAGDGWQVGGGGIARGFGGVGAKVEATFAVVPGETLYIYVGGAGEDATAGPGAGGWNGGGDGEGSDVGSWGGGGGGASDVRRGGEELADRILVAGGGGGGSGWCPPPDPDVTASESYGNGGDARDPVGNDGQNCQVGTVVIGPAGTGGAESEGGSTDGAFGLGGIPPYGKAGAGGGGGWYGGGASDGGGAGAGSSFVTDDFSGVSYLKGVKGDGMILIQEYFHEPF
jgi:hypothetical protein